MKKIGVFVSKIIGSLFVLISLVFSLAVHASNGTGGGMDSTGGSGLALIFRNEGYRAAKIIATLPQFPISSKKFENLVRSTRVEVLDEKLVDAAGRSVAALTSPRTNLIRLNGLKVMEILFAPRVSLIFIVHQYLQMAEIDDEGNKVSRLILSSNEKVLTSISCESRGKSNDIFYVNYKESDSNRDQIGDALSAFSYLRFGDNLEMTWQNSLPLIAKDKSGVLLTINNMKISVNKLFLPQKFLLQGKGEIALDAYYVDAPDEKSRVSDKFICKHVTEDNYPQDPPPQTGDSPGEAFPDGDKVEEDVRKTISEMLIQSFQGQALYAARAIVRIPGFPLNSDQFNELVATTKIEITTDDLYEPGGMKVDALNYPKLKLIRFNYARAVVVMFAPRQSLQLIVHEFLGIAGIDDHDYSVSQGVLVLTGESVTKWTCETESQNASTKVILSFQETDYNGDQVGDESEIRGTNALGQVLQVPFAVQDLSIETLKIEGSQVLWASPDSKHVYQVYLPQKAIESSEKVRLPFFEVSGQLQDKDVTPAGIISCQFGLK